MEGPFWDIFVKLRNINLIGICEKQQEGNGEDEVDTGLTFNSISSEWESVHLLQLKCNL